MNSIKTNTYPENDYRTYLIHYGKKGQKWGVRNAEWYPISDYQAHLARTGGNSKSAGSGKVTNKQGGNNSANGSDSQFDSVFKDNGYKVESRYVNTVSYEKTINNGKDEYTITAHARTKEVDIPKYKIHLKADSEKDIQNLFKTEAEVNKNISKIKNIAINACIDDILEYESLKELGVTRSELKKQFKLVDVNILPRSNKVTLSFDEVEAVGYHYPFVDVNIKTLKTSAPGLDGNNISDTQSGFFDEDHKQRRALSKELNKMDQKLAWDKRFYYDTVRNTRKFEQQLDKIKDPRSKEYKFVKSRLDASYDDTLKKAKGIEKYEKQISDKVDELERRGYRIKERPIERRTMTKGEIATSIGLTLLQYISPAPMLFVPTNKVNGTKYSVKASKQRDPDFKHSEKEREIAAKVKEHGYSSLTDYEKKVYNKAYK